MWRRGLSLRRLRTVAPAPIVEVWNDPLDQIVFYVDAKGTKGRLRDAPADVREIYAEKDRKKRNVLLNPPPRKYGTHYAQPQVSADAVLVSLEFPGFRVGARREEEARDLFIKKMKAHIDALRAAGETEMPALSPALYMAPSENLCLPRSRRTTWMMRISAISRAVPWAAVVEFAGERRRHWARGRTWRRCRRSLSVDSSATISDLQILDLDSEFGY
jgi:hypothetical protein